MIALFDLNSSFEFDTKIDRWWSTKPPELSSLARTWFEVMKMCGPDVNESLHNGYPAACLEVYPFSYVDSFRSHINVGFYYGAFLPDPQGILIGTGKRMRHVKVTLDNQVDSRALKKLIEGSYQDLKIRLSEK
jgi:hypothetical protein